MWAQNLEDYVLKNLTLMRTSPGGDPNLESSEVNSGETLDGHPIRYFLYTKRNDKREELVSYLFDNGIVKFLVLTCPDSLSLKNRADDLQFLATHLKRNK